MADTITLAQLKTQARERADMENFEFVSAIELVTFLNNSYSKLYDILVSRFENYYTTSLEDATTIVASGSSTIS